MRTTDQSEARILTIDQSQPRPHRCGSAHSPGPGSAQSTPGGDHQPGQSNNKERVNSSSGLSVDACGGKEAKE